MSRGQQYYRDQIIKGAPVNIYTATPIAMLEYPYVLGTPTERRPTSAKKSDSYIFDSGIGKDISTTEILKNARELDANYVVPKDIIGNPKETTDNIIKAINKKNNMNINIPLIYPLQSDDTTNRVEHYKILSDKLSNFGIDIEEETVAIGGIRDYSVDKQVLEAAKIRDGIGKKVDIHAFGCGSHKDWIVAIRKWPEIVDSMDTSTPQMNLNNGTVKDASMDSHSHFIPRGKNSTVLHAMQLESTMFMINYLTTDYIRDADAPTQFSSDKLKKEFNKYAN